MKGIDGNRIAVSLGVAAIGVFFLLARSTFRTRPAIPRLAPH